MRILVPFKVTPIWDKVLEEDWAAFSPGGDIAYAGSEINCFDQSALELALRLATGLKEQGSEAHTTAVTCAPALAAHYAEMLYAAGFDEVVLLRGPAAEFSPLATAQRLAGWAEGQRFDCVLCGAEAGMADSGLVPYYLAALLGLPLTAEVEETFAESGGLRVTYRAAEGLRERLISPPCVLAVGNSPAALRAVSLRARLAAKGKAPTEVAFSTELSGAPLLPSAPEPRLTRPQSNRDCHLWQSAPPEQQAARLLELLQSPADAPQQKASGNTNFALSSVFAESVYYSTPSDTAPLSPSVLDWALEHWNRRKPRLALLPDTPAGRALGAALALQTGSPLWRGERLEGWDGRRVLTSKLVCASNLRWHGELAAPALLCLGQPPGEEDVPRVPLPRSKETPPGLVTDRLLQKADATDLQNPGLMVLGGAGLGSAENCADARALAKKLGAGFGLTRAAAMNGWGGVEEIVGQSGAFIAPRRALLLGASGASAFMAGLEGAGRIFAVNRDPDALVLRRADEGLVADAPALVQAMLQSAHRL